MPLPTPFHERTAALCTSYSWKEWAGHHAVRAYDTYPDREYFAFRQAAGLLDVSPLFKYEVTGPDAGAFLAYVSVKDPRTLADGQVTYLCWCDADGKVLDDGTIARWDDEHYRVTSADPSYAHLVKHARGFDVTIEDSSRAFGALALQGPRAREILRGTAGDEAAALRFFRGCRAKIAGVPVEVTRTGYTGDLGYEVWVPSDPQDGPIKVWDALLEAGAPHGILPAGLDALDITRVEAGFLLGGVDYTSARRALIPDRLSSPYELGLGWTVKLDREPFLGQAALRREKREGSRWSFVGLAIDWDALEAMYDSFGLPPDLPTAAWREDIPVYHGAVQVGYATSGTWSPTLKQNLALATVQKEHGKLGNQLSIEWTVEHQRRTLPARVVRKPFFDPERKRT